MLLINRQLRVLLTVVAYSIVVRIPVSFSFAQPTLPERNVYVWFPNGTLRRLSPAPGFFLQPCVRPDGKAAVFGVVRKGSRACGCQSSRPMLLAPSQH